MTKVGDFLQSLQSHGTNHGFSQLCGLCVICLQIGYHKNYRPYSNKKEMVYMYANLQIRRRFFFFIQFNLGWLTCNVVIFKLFLRELFKIIVISLHFLYCSLLSVNKSTLLTYIQLFWAVEFSTCCSHNSSHITQFNKYNVARMY